MHQLTTSLLCKLHSVFPAAILAQSCSCMEVLLGQAALNVNEAVVQELHSRFCGPTRCRPCKKSRTCSTHYSHVRNAVNSWRLQWYRMKGAKCPEHVLKHSVITPCINSVLPMPCTY